MNLGDIAIEARLRSPWQAIDLGFAMLRQWWKPLFLSWLIPSLLVFIPLSIILYKHVWLATLIVWWLKPLWDRGPLYIASRNLFGEDATVKDVLVNLLRLYKTDVLSALTIRRFSFSRSFDMPLTVLEKAKGQTRQTRINQLHRAYGNAANWLTITCVHVEGFFVMAIYSFILLMIPEQYSPDYFNLLVEERANTLFNVLNAWVVYAGMILIGPVYAMCGFALYISRRIELEAWDIEIQFRRLAALHKEKKQRATLHTPLFLLCLAFGMFSLPETSVAESQQAPVPAQTEHQIQVKQDIIDILGGESFHTLKTEKSWRLKNFDPKAREENELPEWFIKVIEFFERNGAAFSTIGDVIAAPFQYLEVILWALAALLLAWLVYKYRQELKMFISPNEPAKEAVEVPDVMFGLDVRRESLPDDIPHEIQLLWECGDTRGAVSLLYRASLSELIYQYGFAFSESDTEGECLSAVKAKAELDLSDFIAKLTQCWQQLAYGHIQPKTEHVEALCERWKMVFNK